MVPILLLLALFLSIDIIGCLISNCRKKKLEKDDRTEGTCFIVLTKCTVTPDSGFPDIKNLWIIDSILREKGSNWTRWSLGYDEDLSKENWENIDKRVQEKEYQYSKSSLHLSCNFKSQWFRWILGNYVGC